MTSEHRIPLNRVQEEALEPELEICDPHIHLWEREGDNYLLDDFQADTGSGHDVRQAVYIECGSGYRTGGPEELQPVGETEFVADVAQSSEGPNRITVTGIVGYADLNRGTEVEPVLAAHQEAGGDRFCGIRHATAWDASEEVRRGHRVRQPGLMIQPGFHDGLAVLARLGLSFDAWLYHPQIPELTAAARAVPELTVVLDHLGGPLGVGPYTDRQRVRDDWRRSIAELAECENVVVKLGGIGMPVFGLVSGHRATSPTSEELAAAWEPEVTFCMERFGVERCMFESNFPVDRRSVSYTVLWNAFKRITAAASPEEKRWLYRDAAVAAYRLPASA